MPEERKLVSILFADVSGSTALGESLDPEDVRMLMGRYYEHARKVIAEHGGTIEKFIGDAVMAVFGLIQAHEDDAERALAAALALRTAVANDEILTAMVRCLPYGQTLTYWPLRGLLDGLMRGEEVAKPQIMTVFTQAGYQTEDASR